MHVAETPAFTGQFEGPGVWRRDDFPTEDAYLTNVADPAALRHELLDGRGFAVLRGVPGASVESYVKLGRALGQTLPQNVKGELLYDVRDEGYNIGKQWGAVGVRFSKTAEKLEFHTDSAPALMGSTPDAVGLFAVQTAKSGGESALVSAYAIHNVISSERPDLLPRLYRSYHVDRRAEVRPGEPLTLRAPVFTHRNGRLTMRYFRFYIPQGHHVAGEPLTAEDIEPLNFIDEVCNRPEMQVRFSMQPGDIQLVSNTYVLHSGASFEDWPEPERRRHLKRLWIQINRE